MRERVSRSEGGGWITRRGREGGKCVSIHGESVKEGGRKGWITHNTYLEEQLGDVLDLELLLVEQEEGALVGLVHQLLRLLVHGLRRVLAVRTLLHPKATLLFL